MEENIQSYLDIYKEQLSYGYIQKVYLILIKYVAELKNSFPNEYRTSNVSPGYLDYTYFPFFNDFFKIS